MTGVTDAENGAVAFDGTHLSFTSSHYFGGDASFLYTVADAAGHMDQANVTLHVTSIDKAPVAGAFSLQGVEDHPYELAFAELLGLGHCSDPDQDPIHLVSVTPEAGAIARALILPNGNVQLVPDHYASGAAGFNYVISDGYKTASGHIDIAFAPVNYGPLVNPDGVYKGTQGSPIHIAITSLRGNDVDVEQEKFDIDHVADGWNGTAEIVGDEVVFTPRAGYSSYASFVYFDRDAPGKVDLYFEPLYRPPTAVSDSDPLKFTIDQGATIDLDPAELMSNDINPDPSDLIFRGFRDDRVVKLDNGLWRFAPAPDFSGAAQLTYAITNDSGVEATTTVTVVVKHVDHPPVAVDDLFDMRESAPHAARQRPPGQRQVARPEEPVVRPRARDRARHRDQGLGDGLVVTPERNFYGEAAFQYQIVDTAGNKGTAWVRLNVAHVNQPPVIGPDPHIAVVQGESFSATLSADLVTDPDGELPLVDLASPGGAPLPSWMSFDRKTSTLAGAAPADYAGTLTLELSASDGGYSVLAPLSLDVGLAPGTLKLAHDRTSDLTAQILALAAPGLGAGATLVALGAQRGAASLAGGAAS